MPHLILLFLVYARRTDRNFIRRLQERHAVNPETAVPLGRGLGTVEAARLAWLTERWRAAWCWARGALRC